MKPKEIQLKLESMKGKSFEYAKDIHLVQSYEIDATDEKFILKTNKNSFRRKFESASEFFKYWYEKPEANGQVEKAKELVAKEDPGLPSEQVIQNNNLADELVAILKDNIDKVKKDAAYIPQAKAIGNSVNSILRVQSLKLDMIKQINKK